MFTTSDQASFYLGLAGFLGCTPVGEDTPVSGLGGTACSVLDWVKERGVLMH